jgi:hypothetical protein
MSARSPVPARLLSTVLLAPLAVVAAHADVQLAVSTAWPTWHDQVVVTAAGEQLSSCAEPAYTLAQTGVEPEIGVTHIDLLLTESCDIPGPQLVRPVAASTTLPRLNPGTYDLRLTGAGTSATANLALRVYLQGEAAIQLPAVVTDAEAASAQVLFPRYSLGFSFSDVELRPGNVVDVHYATVFDPPGPGFQLVPVSYALPVTLPQLAAGDYTVLVEDGLQLVRQPLRVWPHQGCLPAPGTLCLQHGRFRVTATWRDFGGRTGAADARTLPGDTSGLLSFFDPANAELTVKTLDGCGVNDRWWVFVAAGSTVEYDVTVEDLVAGGRRTYHNALGVAPPLVDDTSAFACP